MSKDCGIYLIQNKVNNKMYVGSTISGFNTRWGQHLYHLKNNIHGNKKLQHAFNKYGVDAFEFKVLEVINKDKEREFFFEREDYWFSILNPFGSQGYNIAKTAWCPNPRTFTYKDRVEATMSNTRDGFLVTFPNGLVLHTFNISLLVEEWPELKLSPSCLTNCARGKQPEHKGFKCCFANLADRIEWQPPEEKPIKYVLYSPEQERFESNNLQEFCRERNWSDSHSTRFSMCANTYADSNYEYKRYNVDGWTCYYIENDPGKYISPTELRGQKKFRLFDSELNEFVTQDLTGFAAEKGLNRRVLEKCANPEYPNKTYKGWYCFDYDDESYLDLFKTIKEVIVVKEDDANYLIVKKDKENFIDYLYYLKTFEDISNHIEEIKKPAQLKRHINTNGSYKNCSCVTLKEELVVKKEKVNSKEKFIYLLQDINPNFYLVEYGDKNTDFEYLEKHDKEEFVKSVLNKIYKSNSATKYWRIYYPDGNTIIITDLQEFAKQNNLKYHNLSQVARNQKNHHKNFKCRQVIPK
jgi:group I intron endonuclease